MNKLLVILLLLPCFSFGQVKLDSLKTVLAQSEEDTSKVKTLTHLAWELEKSDPETAIKFGKQALDLADSLHFKIGIASANRLICRVYMQLAKYDLAMEHILAAVRYYETVKDKKMLASSYNVIGEVNRYLGNDEQAIANYEKSLALSIEMEMYSMIAQEYNNIGVIHLAAKRFEEAKKFIMQSLDIRKEHELLKDLGRSYANVGVWFYFQQNTDSALFYFNTAIDLFEELGEENDAAGMLLNTGVLYGERGDHQRAISNYKRALEVANKYNHVDLQRICYENLTNEHEDIGEFEQALNYHRLGGALKDSIFNENSSNQIAKLQEEFSSEQREKEIALLKQKNEMQDMRMYGLTGGLVLVLILAFVALRGYRHKRKSNMELAAKNEEVTTQKEVIDQKNKEITDSINYAQRIQEAILPPEGIVRLYLRQCFVYYQPKDVVAGDFYWLESAGDNVLFAAADCTGHGVPGAMVSMVCQNALNAAVKEFKLTEPGAILNKANEIVTEQFATGEYSMKDGMDIALVSLNSKTREAVYAGANSPLYHVSGGELNQIKADKQPIGLYAESNPFTNHSLQLKEGDSIYIFSDGFADQFGGPLGKKFKYKPFRELILANQDKPMEEQKQLLDECIENWRGELEQVDDICIIGVRV